MMSDDKKSNIHSTALKALTNAQNTDHSSLLASTNEKYQALSSEEKPLESPDQLAQSHGVSNQKPLELELEEKEIEPSPLLHPDEKLMAREFGHSFDAHQKNPEWTQIELEKMSYCLALAVEKHIQFGRGHLFLSDLALGMKKMESESLTAEEMRFSYKFSNPLKIPMDKKLRKYEEPKPEIEIEDLNPMTESLDNSPMKL